MPKVNVDVPKLLALVNAKRALHNAPPVTWSNAHAASAEAVAAREVFEHSGNKDVSENLYIATAEDRTFSNAVNDWYNEERMYAYGSPGFNAATGHFTALVWKASREIGACLWKLPNGFYLYVLHMSPRGNAGAPRQYALNVTPHAVM